MTNKKMMLILAGAAVVSSGAFVAADASAIIPHPWRSFHALNCVVAGGSILGLATPGAQIANVSNGFTYLVCPIDSDTHLNFKTTDLHAEVNGYANGGGTWGAQACVTYGSGGGGGGTCGDEFWAINGVKHADLDLSAWRTASQSDYPYVLVTLGPQLAGSSNVVWGIRLYK